MMTGTNPAEELCEDVECVFTAYFEGTSNAVDRRMTQIGLFFELDRGIDVGQTEESARDAARRARPGSDGIMRFKLAVNGCGYENGIAGIVFAYGMQTQCLDVARSVRATRAGLGEPRMQLNLVGLSRGAVAALAIAALVGERPELFVCSIVPKSADGTPSYSEAEKKFLASKGKEEEKSKKEGSWYYDWLENQSESMRKQKEEALVENARAKIVVRRSLRLHLLLFDPVPGNQIMTTKMLDPMGYTTANSAIDVTGAKGILRRVLAIYPYEPLPAITFHAPLVPTYPSRDCHVEEIVSLGCHQGALLCAPNRISCRLSYCMVRNFLTEKCAIKFRACRPFDDCLATNASKLRVLEMLRVAATEDARKHGGQVNKVFISRAAHAKTPHVRPFLSRYQFLTLAHCVPGCHRSLLKRVFFPRKF